jgi:hypothetical protein
VASDNESTPQGGGARARRALGIVGAILAAGALSAILVVRANHDRGPAPAPSAALIGAPSASASAAAAPPPAGPAELAIVAPIIVGSTSKGWKVEAISAVHEGTIDVKFVEEKGRGVIDLFVATSSEDGAVPPATAGRYAVYFSARRALPEDADRLARVLAKAIEKNQGAPVPPGLGPFNARPQEHQPL